MHSLFIIFSSAQLSIHSSLFLTQFFFNF